jgi:hypothetical protein
MLFRIIELLNLYVEILVPVAAYCSSRTSSTSNCANAWDGITLPATTLAMTIALRMDENFMTYLE